MKGTTPAGAATEREASEWVRAMFGRVAHRYDLANHLLSLNIDRYWRARTVARVRTVLRAPGAKSARSVLRHWRFVAGARSRRGRRSMGQRFLPSDADGGGGEDRAARIPLARI